MTERMSLRLDFLQARPHKSFVLSLKFDIKGKLAMGKSRLALLLLFSFTLNIDTGFALRCYGCEEGSRDELSYTVFPKNPPKCSDDGFGKEFDCSGFCAKFVGNGKSVCF